LFYEGDWTRTRNHRIDRGREVGLYDPDDRLDMDLLNDLMDNPEQAG
jgi:hypothetical protein